MRNLLFKALALALCITWSSAPAEAGLNRNSRVTARGIGAVHAGMTVRQAERALGDKLVADGDPLDDCKYMKPRRGPKGISFMVIVDRIARVDVDNAFTKTAEGAGIGSTEAQIKRLYKGRVSVEPHKYTDGHYLVVTSPDKRHMIIFETDGKRVTQFRSGRTPEVTYVEGCA